MLVHFIGCDAAKKRCQKACKLHMYVYCWLEGSCSKWVRLASAQDQHAIPTFDEACYY